MKVSSILYSRPLSNGLHQIKIRIHNNNKTTYVNTNFSILKSQWDSKKRRIKESKNHPENININKELDRLEYLYKGETDLIKFDEVKQFDFCLLIKKFEIHIKKLQAQEKYGTYRKFILVKNYLNKFYESNKYQNNINKDFLTNFEIWLYDNTKVRQNGIHSYFKTFRNIVNKCINEDPINFPAEKNPFNYFKVSIKEEEKPKLNISQLNKIINLDLSKNKRLNDIKDYFLFSFYSSGMRISDICCLKWGNLKEGRLIYKMRKTGKNISLPLNKNQLIILLNQLNKNDINALTKEITNLKKEENKIFKIENFSKSFNKNSYSISPIKTKESKLNDLNIDSKVLDLIELMSIKNPNEYVFNILDSKKIKSKTDLLKQISSKSCMINKELKKISSLADIGLEISFHISRHTFSDLMRKSGKSIYDISKVLGHSDISITEKYLKSLDYDSTDNSVNDFYNSL